jgi:hypothetical protein
MAAEQKREKDEREKEKREMEEKQSESEPPESMVTIQEENKENGHEQNSVDEKLQPKMSDKVKRLDAGSDILVPVKKKSMRPGSHTSPPHVGGYHSNVLLNRGGIYQYHRKEKRRVRTEVTPIIIITS